MHSARLLESLSSNAEFSTKFVEQSGLQLLLRLYTLRHLPATFGSSAAAHALVAAVRVLNQSAASPATSSKVVEALTGQLRTTLLLGMVSPRIPSSTTLRHPPRTTVRYYNAADVRPMILHLRVNLLSVPGEYGL